VSEDISTESRGPGRRPGDRPGPEFRPQRVGRPVVKDEVLVQQEADQADRRLPAADPVTGDQRGPTERAVTDQQRPVEPVFDHLVPIQDQERLCSCPRAPVARLGHDRPSDADHEVPLVESRPVHPVAEVGGRARPVRGERSVEDGRDGVTRGRPPKP
jgi:hypothetical protein